ncbi:MAG TPA: (2Fe-2S) ferredoxin domain-containing protein [Anaerolineaceae bacterium]|jgi:NADP-reducing hydrogenase subunit HndB|nr:(2Fe-2S) ferredoxin domain-containing protein [Longilinea sp.]HNS63315.1 (2Fe-2S) ferredoxin domain-containing protein [Anaerolineaceae bacterium]HNZ00765.1 (2Fe-2S) ferredoxin domain-containing protein [Anaerolineaceae bacterium]HOH19375.1 (2Fe-2S) ferredoxin domain-containing protein [Anaerolineaceae bacterium]HOU43852.1 (2Fe-2S) ferredoxin domain-containing protein [Anaerolineaceae bacterium]
MPTVKSLEDLKRIREEALQKRQVKAASGEANIVVAMGTCGIAAGAREAMKAILNLIETENIPGIIVTQTGCIGLCEREPIVQVQVGEQPKVTYGKVTPEIARRIVKEHVVEGKIIEDHVIPM